MNDFEPRMAVLEEIARSTKAALERIDRRLDTLEQRQDSQFRWLLGIMIGGFGTTFAGYAGLLGVLAHGFHWI
jgi:uncharacterized membrane protein YjjP (DUF1212 family)